LVKGNHSLAEEFKTFYERDAHRLTAVSIKYEGFHLGLGEKINLLDKRIQETVIDSLNRWLTKHKEMEVWSY